MEPELVQDVLAATDGDVEALRRTNVIVFYETIQHIEECLSNVWYAIHALKIHSGTLHMIDDMEGTIALAREHDVVPYIGGGIVEAALEKNALGKTVKDLHALGIDTIEISNNSEKIEPAAFERLMKDMRKDFGSIIVEIGLKTPENVPLRSWLDDLHRAQDTGADEIVFEGGGGGNCGIYDDEGRPRTLLVAKLLSEAGPDSDNLIIESASASQQGYWINGLRWDTRMGNVPCDAKFNRSLMNARLSGLRRDRIEEVAVAREELLHLARAIEEQCKALNMNFDAVLQNPRLFVLPVGKPHALREAKDAILGELQAGPQQRRGMTLSELMQRMEGGEM